ncbi:MAG TPA: DUF5655 domain-containing protein [Candidatus Sulfotelmatobacter sp.]|nr:DUF5655 domain-containing protein [Candidatus Sulfotelmatobacter sp.]
MAKTAAAKKTEKTAARKTSGLYDVHPGVAAMQKWISELKQKTGRTVEEWIALTQKEGPADGHKARVVWLKKKHKMGNNSAWWIAERAGGKGWEEDTPEAYLAIAEKYVEQQYAGKKEQLRPLYGELLNLGKSVADDVKACPCQTMVPLYRNHVFAQIKPTTNSRIDLGFALAKYKGKLPKRLIDTGGLAKKDRITHRIEITEVGQIDDEVRKWVKAAYELDAE